MKPAALEGRVVQNRFKAQAHQQRSVYPFKVYRHQNKAVRSQPPLHVCASRTPVGGGGGEPHCSTACTCRPHSYTPHSLSHPPFMHLIRFALVEASQEMVTRVSDSALRGQTGPPWTPPLLTLCLLQVPPQKRHADLGNCDPPPPPPYRITDTHSVCMQLLSQIHFRGATTAFTLRESTLEGIYRA